VREITIDLDPLPDESLFDLTTLKADLRCGDEFDTLLVGQYIPDAIAWAERETRRSIQARAVRWILECLPYGYDTTLYLPRGKVQSVTSIVYSSNGSPVTLRGPTSGSPAGTDYQEDLRGHQGRVMPLRGASWPSADEDVPSPVVVTFVAGWTAATIPAEIKRAMTARIQDSMELPGSDSFNALIKDVEFPEKLLSGYLIRS